MVRKSYVEKLDGLMRASKHVHRAKFLVASLAVAALSASACASDNAASGNAAPDDVRLGYQTNIWGMPVYAAVQEGYFKTAGVPLKEIQVDSGNRVRDLMVARQADVGTFAGPTLNVGMDKSDIVAVGMVANTGRTVGIVARKGAGIKGLADLRGKKIAIQAGSSIGDVAVQKVLPSVGLHEGDYQLVNIPVNNMVAAMAQGAIDAMVNVEPYNAIATSQGLGERVVDFGKFDKLPLFIGMRQGFIDDHHDQAVAILSALLKSSKTWQTDPQAAYKVISDFYTKTGFKVDLSQVTDAASRLDVTTTYTDGVKSYLTDIAKAQKQAGLIAEIPDYSKTINTSLLQEAAAKR